MTLLILGLALWALAHGVKVHAPERRAQLAADLGEWPVKLGFAVLILAAVALMVLGYQRAAFVNLWYPPGWTVHLNNLLMLIAVAVYTAGGIPGHMRAWVRHPQLAGVKIWATAHLLVNGDLASVVLFGGLLAWGVVTMIGVNRRDGKPAKPAPGPLKWDLLHLGVTVVAFGAIAWLHDYLGVWPYPG